MAAHAAEAVEQLQIYVSYVEKTAFDRAKVELKINTPTFEDWIKFVSSDVAETYIDACFNSAVIFSKFPLQKKQMMQNALSGFNYCQKLWE